MDPLGPGQGGDGWIRSGPLAVDWTAEGRQRGDGHRSGALRDGGRCEGASAHAVGMGTGVLGTAHSSSLFSTSEEDQGQRRERRWG